MRHKLEQAWLSHYRDPLPCIHDPGQEFVGTNFQLVLVNLNIEPVPTNREEAD